MTRYDKATAVITGHRCEPDPDEPSMCMHCGYFPLCLSCGEPIADHDGVQADACRLEAVI